MIKIIIFLLFPAMLMAIPAISYRKHTPRHMWLWLRMAHTQNCPKLLAYLLCIVVMLFHVSFFSVFPSDMGLMLSTLAVFYMLSPSRTVKLLTSVRHSRKSFICLAVLAVITAPIPHLLSTSVVLAFMLLGSLFFPAKESSTFYKSLKDDPDADRKFTDYYFKNE